MSNHDHCCDRRGFLKLGGMTLFISAVEPRLLRANPSLNRIRGRRPSGKTLVHVWQRGGQDGLHVTVPTEAGEYATYQSYRPTLQFPMAQLTPQQLTPDLALSPSLNTGLYDLWTQGKLAVLPTVGYPTSSRSHFDGMKFIENGTPFNKSTADGWLNRYLQLSGPSGDPLQAVSFTNGIPVLLGGSFPSLSFSSIGALEVTSNVARNTKYLDIQREVYPAYAPERTYDPEVATAGSGLVTSIDAIEVRQPLPPTDPGANYPTGTFANNLKELAQLMKAGFQIEVANVEIGGWDTHTQQNGTFNNLIGQMSDAIRAFTVDLGPTLMQDTLIVTVSEFGRTARENGNAGTDHGNAWTTFVIAPNLNPGVHMGPTGWPGLDNLRENRDLAYTIDFRDLYAEILTEHMGLYDPSIFPGWSHTPVGFL